MERPSQPAWYVGRSLSVDRRSKAKTVAKKGEGDRGDPRSPVDSLKASALFHLLAPPLHMVGLGVSASASTATGMWDNAPRSELHARASSSTLRACLRHTYVRECKAQLGMAASSREANERSHR